MDIQSAILSTPLLAKATQLNLSQWFVGQILNATITERKSSDTLGLKIQNQNIEAKTDQNRPINVGDQLKLIVEKQGNPVVLRVLQQTSTKVVHEIKQQLLRESMPKQAGMEKLTSVLNQVSKSVSDAIKVLPNPIEQQFRKLIEQLPLRTNLNNEVGLKTAIKNSGIFLESKLLADANGKKTEQRLPGQISRLTSTQEPTQTQHQAIKKDLKSSLLQLSDVISKYKQNTEFNEKVFIKKMETTTAESTKNASVNAKNTGSVIDLAAKMQIDTLSKQIESSIARIEVNQSKAIVIHDNQLPLWSIEMPVKDKQNIDLLKLNIQADKDSKSKNAGEKL